MKKYLFLTIVLISAIITGFATKPDKVYEGEDQMALYWFVDGNYTGRQNTILNEVPLSGCPNTGIFHCEDGYDAADLIDPEDPGQGLKEDATVNDFIRKQSL